jgi:hypothetical protein
MHPLPDGVALLHVLEGLIRVPDELLPRRESVAPACAWVKRGAEFEERARYSEVAVLWDKGVGSKLRGHYPSKDHGGVGDFTRTILPNKPSASPLMPAVKNSTLVAPLLLRA